MLAITQPQLGVQIPDVFANVINRKGSTIARGELVALDFGSGSPLVPTHASGVSTATYGADTSAFATAVAPSRLFFNGAWFAIALHDIDSGQIGRVQLSGRCRAKVGSSNVAAGNATGFTTQLFPGIAGYLDTAWTGQQHYSALTTSAITAALGDGTLYEVVFCGYGSGLGAVSPSYIDGSISIQHKKIAQITKDFGAATLNVSNIGAVTTEGTLASGDASIGGLLRCTTGSVINDAAGFISPVCGRSTWSTDAIFHWSIGGTDIADMRIWVGLATVDLKALSDTYTTESIAAMRYLSASSANFISVTNDGTAGGGTTTDTGVAAAIGVPYRTRIVMRAQDLVPASIEFYHNEALVSTHTTKLPPNTAALIAVFKATTLAASTRRIDFSRAVILTR